MARDDDPPGAVGYGKPPRATRFQPGRSGNPKGRPKGSKNFSTLLQEELDARVVVTENGRRRTISKRQAVAKQLVNKAAAGDPRALPILLNEARLSEERSSREVLGELGSEDEAVLARLAQRMREAQTAPNVVGEPEKPGDGCAEGAGG